jgi:uncharacterized protein
MQLNNRFHKVFGRIPILGMIHLAGQDPVQRALKEIAIYAKEGVDGAIIENYVGSTGDVIATLEALQGRDLGLVLGINVLPNEYNQAFPIAKRFGADFIQLDHVAGTYRGHRGPIELSHHIYEQTKMQHPDVVVLGGVHPKYYEPKEGSNLEVDLMIGMQRAEAIVVTGEGTGLATPLDKVKLFRSVLGDHPLIIGAGLTLENVEKSLGLADGAIVGSWFKPNGDIHSSVDPYRVRDFMVAVKAVRAYRAAL